MSEEKLHPLVPPDYLPLSAEIAVARDDDSEEGRAKKYLIHKHAHATLNHYIATQNHVAAFMLAFSLLEDRIRAMYVVLVRDIDKRIVQEDELKQSISKVFHLFYTRNEITKEQNSQLFKLFTLRNKLVHNAMWHLHIFRAADVASVKNMHRQITNLTEKMKRRAKKLS
jgi:hypothetical protein